MAKNKSTNIKLINLIPKKFKGKKTIVLLAVIAVLWVLNNFNFISYKSIMTFLDLTDKPATSSEVSVHFIDVGQGDCTLIKAGDTNILIDAGEVNYGTKVVSYLEAQGVEKLDYVIGTHPHTDHIGGLVYVLENIKADKIIMPRVKDDLVPTTKTYENLLLTIKKAGLKISSPKAGQSFELDSDAVLKILGPNKDYNNLNSYSIVVKLEHIDNSFLFTGDIESDAEGDLINSDLSLSAKVLKVAHHGSSSSSKKAFLDEVNPRYFVIQCGKDNSYNHPSQVIVDRLLDITENVYRTDLDGTIVFESDGIGLNVILEKDK